MGQIDAKARLNGNVEMRKSSKSFRVSLKLWESSNGIIHLLDRIEIGSAVNTPTKNGIKI